MNEVLIFFGIMFIALIFEIFLVFFFYDKHNNDTEDMIAILVVQALINAFVIAVIATVRYSS